MSQDEIALLNLIDGCASRVMAQVRARIYLPRHPAEAGVSSSRRSVRYD